MNKEVSDFDDYIVKRSEKIHKYIIEHSKILSMPTAKVTAIVGNKYSVRLIGDKNDITGLNSYSHLPIVVGDEVLLMVIGNSLTNAFIFSKKII